jgi:hypothetical protein
MNDNARTLAKVQALLAQAEHPNTTATEAEAFSARAAEIMLKHSIDMAMLSTVGGQQDAPECRNVVLQAPYVKQKAIILNAICRPQGVQVIMLDKTTVAIVGFPSDLDGVEMLFASLLVQAGRDVLRAVVPSREDTAAYRRSWMLGFASAVGHRVEERMNSARREANESHGSGTELVLADRKAQVSSYFRQQFPHTRADRTRTSGSGRESGYAAGNRADLGSRKVGSGRAQIGR